MGPIGSGSWRIRSASVKPSISGIMASSSTSANGDPAARARSSAASASRPPSTTVGFMPQLVSISSRIRRLVALSSTTRTGRPCTPGGLRRHRAAPTGPVAGREPHREVERAPPADLALQPDLPAHHLDQPGRDRQAQPRAAVLAGGRSVRLGEGLEELLLLVGGDADARVADGEVQADLLLGPRLHIDAKHDLAPLGELDGVAHQVDDDLAEAVGVAREGIGHVGRDVVGQLQPFLVARRASVATVSSRVSRRSKSTRSRSSLPASILEKSRMSLITVSR